MDSSAKATLVKGTSSKHAGITGFRRLLLRFAASPSKAAGTSHVSVMPALPVELLLQILANVNDSRDLCSVRLACKLFGDIATPLLYRKVSVPLFGRKRLHFARQTKLYQAIQSPRILSYVTVALLSLGRWNSCPKFDIKGMMPHSLRRCSCNQLDHLLGLALQVLPNLQVLHLHCYLCRDQDSGRHRYLAQLSTTNLHQLSFICFCMEKGSQVLASQMLQSNAMASLKNLGLEWMSVQPEEPMDLSLEAHLIDPCSLPHLTSLQHDGSRLATSILSTRPISRLAYQRTGSLTRRRESMLSIHRRMPLHQDTLTHLFVDDVAPFIHDMIASAPQYYRRLKYLGSFKYQGSSFDEMLSKLKALSAIVHLEAIEVTWSVPESSDSSLAIAIVWNRENVSRLEENHRSLRKVYYLNRGQPITHPTAALWERTDCWRERAVPALKYMDMIGGDFDKL